MVVRVFKRRRRLDSRGRGDRLRLDTSELSSTRLVRAIQMGVGVQRQVMLRAEWSSCWQGGVVKLSRR